LPHADAAAVATDGHRLGQAQIERRGSEKMAGVILPAEGGRRDPEAR